MIAPTYTIKIHCMKPPYATIFIVYTDKSKISIMIVVCGFLNYHILLKCLRYY